MHSPRSRPARRDRRARRVLAPAVGALALVLGTTAAVAPPASARQAPERGSAGIGDPYFPLDGNGGYDVAHYDVRDRYDQASGRLSGSTIVRATARQDLSAFSLDLLLPVRSVRVDGQEADWVKQGSHELVVTPSAPLATGSAFTVRVRYAGKPGRRGYLGERNWLTDGVETVTMNEPHMAPWWFTSNDHPLDKATFDIRITGAARDTVVSNGELVGRRTRGGSATTHWRSTQPMATYLAFFAMGPYEVRRGTRDGLPWYAAVAADLPQPARRKSMRAMVESPRIVSWLSSVLGPYPFSSTGGLTTRLPVGFALENQTRPTYPVLGPGRRSTVVHELAHQWFGDSVSVSGWRDIWLNEGFASFMEELYVEQRGGRSAQASLLRTYDRKLSDTAFWRLPIGDPGPARLFDDPVYTRGAMAVQALRHRIGETAFLTLLRTWLSTRQHGNGSVADFEALAEQVSGIELTPFFDAWLRATTPPARTVDNGLV